MQAEQFSGNRLPAHRPLADISRQPGPPPLSGPATIAAAMPDTLKVIEHEWT